MWGGLTEAGGAFGCSFLLVIDLQTEEGGLPPRLSD